MSNALTAILNQRGQVHGDFETQTFYSQMLKDPINHHRFNNMRGNGALHPMVYDSLEMIALKMSRILAGSQFYEDHWVDIAGYAMLVVNKIKAANQEKAPAPYPQVQQFTPGHQQYAPPPPPMSPEQHMNPEQQPIDPATREVMDELKRGLQEQAMRQRHPQQEQRHPQQEQRRQVPEFDTSEIPKCIRPENKQEASASGGISMFKKKQ